MSTGSTPRVLVVIPTYNERENLPRIIARVRAAVPTAHVLVADDSSPDGTGEVAEALAADDDHVRVLHRPGKQGLGAAYLDGFAWGMDHGFDVLVEMDADGSHQPEQLPDLLARVEAGADLVLGSRYVPGGSVVNWPRHRELLSRGGNTYVRLVLGLPLRDATGGYRAFRGRRWRSSVWPTSPPGVLLPGRPGVARGRGRAAGRGGADHLRRARGRHQQDEPCDRRRGALAGHPVGRPASARPDHRTGHPPHGP